MPNSHLQHGRQRGSDRGFTIVEMLIVLGVIMILIGLLLPALRGVQQRSRKMVELNHLRQIGAAWNMYANSHNDAALPGYLDHEPDGPDGQSVQDYWRVRFEYPQVEAASDPDVSEDPPQIKQEIAAPWTWRLMHYLDHNFEVVWGYRGEADTTTNALVAQADEVALTPAFAYNGFYIGGWWEFSSDAPGSLRPRPRFHNAVDPDDPRVRLAVVSTRLSSIRRPTEVVVFCPGASLEEGVYPRLQDNQPGSHIVTPPNLGEQPQWRVPRLEDDGGGGGFVVSTSVGGDAYTLEVFADPGPIDPALAHVPLGRFNRLVPVVHADLSTDTVTPQALDNPERWIDVARNQQGPFQPFMHGVAP